MSAHLSNRIMQALDSHAELLRLVQEDPSLISEGELLSKAVTLEVASERLIKEIKGGASSEDVVSMLACGLICDGQQLKQHMANNDIAGWREATDEDFEAMAQDNKTLIDSLVKGMTQ